MSSQKQQTIRQMTRGVYDLQQLRIQMGNRVVSNFRSKLGLEAGKKDTSSAEASKAIEVIKTYFYKITDGVVDVTRRKSYKYQGIIDNYTELCLVSSYLKIQQQEDMQFRALGHELDRHEIWTEFLADVKGIGPAMGAVIISEIDISKAKYPSSLWKYSGLDVVDGEGRSRRKDHLVERDYRAYDGTRKTKKVLSFNAFLKTKLTGVLGPSLLRAKNEKYSKIYNDYRHRIESDPSHAGFVLQQANNHEITPPGYFNYVTKSKEGFELHAVKPDIPVESFSYHKKHPDSILLAGSGKLRLERSSKDKTVKLVDGKHVIAQYSFGKSPAHRHAMATRYMVKMFLIDLYKHWRPLEGLDVAPSYHEAKQGHVHSE